MFFFLGDYDGALALLTEMVYLIHERGNQSHSLIISGDNLAYKPIKSHRIMYKIPHNSTRSYKILKKIL
jgi:hypothetical protein